MDTLRDLAKLAKRRLKGCDDSKKKADNNADIYNAVKEMICSEEIVTDPIGRLTDNNVFDGLNDIDKQRYVLCLAEQYNKCVQYINKIC
ncbi:MAG: hypothetical protein K2I79_02070 [Clostridia bacterium]|nr:hypothetical protein [Clostridia bacterium]